MWWYEEIEEIFIESFMILEEGYYGGFFGGGDVWIEFWRVSSSLLKGNGKGGG